MNMARIVVVGGSIPGVPLALLYAPTMVLKVDTPITRTSLEPA